MSAPEEKPDNDLPIEKLLTGRQVQEILGIDSNTLWRWANSGKIPCVRVGRAVRYRRVDIETWVSKHTHGKGGPR